MKDFTITNNNHRNLDGLRAIGILLVLARHFFDRFLELSFCWVGLDMLFALSGLLITGILIETKEDGRYFQKFYMRRILRIFPLYYLLVIGFTVYIYFLARVPENFNYYKENLGFFYTYTQNWSYIYNGMPKEAHLNHTWSLAIDEQIYLVWPLLIWLCRTPKQLTYLCAGILLFSLCFRIGYIQYLGYKPNTVHPIPYFHHTLCRIDSFGAGALLYCLVKFKSPWLTKKKMLLVALVSLLLLILFMILDRSPNVYRYYLANFGFTLAGIHFSVWLYFGITGSSRILNSIFSNSVLVYVGKISYSLYVYHWPILVFLMARLSNFYSEITSASVLMASLTCLVITFLVSMLSYEYFERPIVKIKRRFSYGKSPQLK